jgi:CRISPR-associated protein Cmr5
MAQKAYAMVRDRISRAQESECEKYTSFAREFPSLVQSCGLAQAVAFALAKGEHHHDYAADLAAVLRSVGYTKLTDPDALAKESREASLTSYLRLSRDSLTAAVWLKRYVEALDKQQVSPGGKQT